MEEFNYEDTFMGVMEGKRGSYLRTFRDDYRLKRLTESIKKDGFKILDIGCGGGILTESLNYYYPKARIFGCDVSSKAISYAKKYGRGKVNYSVLKGKKLPYRDNFFDVAICLDVMEHIPDVEFFLNEVRRVLKKGGRFFLLVPCEGQPLTHTWFSQKIKLGEKMTFKRYGHIHPEFTHKCVKDLLEEHNFKINRITYSEHLLYQTISLIVYFIPREIMDFILGTKAKRYSDSGIIRDQGRDFDIFIILRNTWLVITKILRFLTEWELELLKNVPFTAWKIIILSEKR